ncbi:alpha-N-acetylgalactosaminide alpha-2,6-sialyltransferase 1 [Hippoglossus stenolepis]|uniref:alpha-N-acetylgalactosaminide alpha-2,6-sialyltransferase 1 n=1 Tax=Hippoglossus stenolepis TaxID=195615 RepID=UPI001FAE8ADC|nr:alpha-N-acetylgalactosaminide alpha-2,6-sialyltransferase 1 [Hippoglossus stenolepis]
MAVQAFRTLSFLLVISLSTMLVILSWGHLLDSISWAAYPGKHRLSDSYLLDKRGAIALPPALFINTTQGKSAGALTKVQTGRRKTSAQGAEAETPIPVLSKKSFTKLPQWDFEDVYNQDAPARHTTCATSLRNSEDESFKKAFLPDIRLFVHKDSINMSEWNRLSHFNNPFGFMNYTYDDVMTSMKLIPKPKEPLLLPLPDSGGCVHCAVVGNSGILTDSKMGKEIDSHDYVFRMNGAAIKGYEEDVGNKTSVYVHTSYSISTSVYLLKDYGYKSVPNDKGIKYVLIPEGMRDFIWLQALLKEERITAQTFHGMRPRTYYAGQFNDSRFYVLHQDFLRYVRNRFLKSSNLNGSSWAIYRPSNGAFTLFLALQTCDTVDAYGFITEDHEKYPNYYVHRGVKSKVVFYINHDFLLEMKTWKRLHDSKIIKLYQRTDSDAGTEKPNPH